MKKKEYLKPEQNVVVLQHKAMLMQTSQVNTNLYDPDGMSIDDTTPVDNTFWGR